MSEKNDVMLVLKYKTPLYSSCGSYVYIGCIHIHGTKTRAIRNPHKSFFFIIICDRNPASSLIYMINQEASNYNSLRFAWVKIMNDDDVAIQTIQI